MTGNFSTLTARLDLLEAAGAAHYNRPLFEYIRSLAERSEKLPTTARRRLEEIAGMRLADFQVTFHEAQADARERIELLEERHGPQAALRERFDRADFSGVMRYAKRLERKLSARDPWQKKSQYTLVDAFGAPEDLAQLELLLELDGDQVEPRSFTVTSPEAVTAAGWQMSRTPLRLLQEATESAKSRRAINVARDQKPEIAGPLNSQTLATQLLEELQKISPVYLKRLVTYLETLRLLEQLPTKRR